MTLPGKVDKLAGILNKQGWVRPIIVEKDSMVILDGHHRYNALKALGCGYVPAYLVDYDDVELGSWRPGIVLSKDDVVNMGISGYLFPPKTTRHSISIEKTKIMLEGLR